MPEPSAQSAALKRFDLKQFVRGGYPLAMLAGLLLTAAFPKWSLAGCAWIAPGLLLAITLGKPLGQIFRLGYVAGLTHYLTVLYWLIYIPFPVGAISGWLSLSAYMALYPALWVVLCNRLLPAKSGGESSDTWSRLAALPLITRAMWALACAVIWVAMEMFVGRFLTGFPWCFLGVTQYQIISLIQIASVTGVYGVSFLVVWLSVSLIGAAALVLRRPAAYWSWINDVMVPGCALIGVLWFANYQFYSSLMKQSSSRELKLAMVQPSIPQRLIFDPNETTNRFNKLMELSEVALATKPDLLLWPEAALPNISEEMFQRIVEMIRRHKSWMIFGADDAREDILANGQRQMKYYNGAFLFDPEARMNARYYKRRLVIFGEYVPLSNWLPFLRYLTPIDGGFSPGTEATNFELPDHGVKAGILICFEDVFPHLASEYVKEDTDLLINLTNNGWFGESAAQWQHAAIAVFRAVEQGLRLVRSTNNGLTCWIDQHGRMYEVYFGDSSDIYGEGFKTATIPLREKGEKYQPTIYHRYGDWFGWSCVGVTVLLLGFSWYSSRGLRQAANV